MKKLIVCNTYYQLIISIQLKITLFKNDNVSIWLSDSSVNYKKIIERIKEIKIFDDVKIIYTKHTQRIIKDFLFIFKYNFLQRNIIDIDLYDEIIFYNLDLIFYSISDTYKYKSHKVIWSRMEEGLFSYNTDFETGNRIKITRKIRKVLNRTDIVDEIKNYYCFYPELKTSHREWNLIAIPPILTQITKLRKLLNHVFDYTPYDFEQKYIFFASSSDIDGRPFGETELVLNIAKKVGIKNLLVKTHPRDTRNVYEKHGISTLSDSYIPWEVIQLNWEDNSNKILLTVNSGAFISIMSLLKLNTKGIFLYSVIKNKADTFSKNRDKEIRSTLDKLHSMHLAENIIAFNDCKM